MVKYKPYLPPAIILFLTLLISLLLWISLLPDQMITVQTDLGNITLLLGLICFLAWIGGQFTLIQDRQKSLKAIQMENADEKRRFLRRLDHELKNPLTAIRAGLANLAEMKLEDTQMQTIASVEAQTLRLSRLASDLRKLAELESRPLDKSGVDVNDLIQEAFNLALDQPNAKGKELKLNIPQTPWPLPSIQADRDLLFLAVHNLMDNALKFTKPGNTIEMRGFEDGSSLVIEVADTGQGIPSDEVDHIGEELYRGRNSRGIPGNGLGLALVFSIVNLHRGKVTVRSKEGKGTVVALRIPVS
jgi:two-component system, OmpR family, sensor kinase